jgi:type I restriction enzyme R subunit
MESIQVYCQNDIDSTVELFLNGNNRTDIDPIIDKCVDIYKDLIVEEQIEFKSSAKAYVRTYNFLAAILPYGSVEWEKLSIFLNLLVPKLPSPEGDDYTDGLLEDVDLESYRVEAQETMRIQLDNEDSEVNPVPVATDVAIAVPELDSLTNILKEFHDIFGDIDWTDEDKVKKQIADLPGIVSQNETYQNAMRYSDKENAREESDKATLQAILSTMSSGIELYKQIQANDSLRKWIYNMVFNETYDPNIGNALRP